MNENVLIPKMTRIDKSKRKVKIPLLNLVVIACSTLLIIASTFVNLEIKHYIIPHDIFSGNKLYMEDFIYSFHLIPQIPTIMFLCSALGKRMALTSILLYIAIGLSSIPLFALGGGIQYVGQHGFGYILAYIPAVILAGYFLNKQYSFLNMIKATLTGVLSIHLLGIIYMIIVALFRHSGSNFITNWINAQSGLKIIYDLVGSFVLILIGKYLHSALKYISD